MPDCNDDTKSPTSKKFRTGTKSISKSKISTQKKCEVSFSENIQEIKEADQTNKENSQPQQLTPLKPKSPSKLGLKSVKEHVKTPYSKIKANQDDELGNTPMNEKSLTNSKNKGSQLIFTSEMNNLCGNTPKNQSNTKVKDMTPPKSILKTDRKMKSKSPLRKIAEERNESENITKVVIPIVLNDNIINASELKENLTENVDFKLESTENVTPAEEQTKENEINILVNNRVEQNCHDENKSEQTNEYVNSEVPQFSEAVGCIPVEKQLENETDQFTNQN